MEGSFFCLPGALRDTLAVAWWRRTCPRSRSCPRSCHRSRSRSRSRSCPCSCPCSWCGAVCGRLGWWRRCAAVGTGCGAGRQARCDRRRGGRWRVWHGGRWRSCRCGGRRHRGRARVALVAAAQQCTDDGAGEEKLAGTGECRRHDYSFSVKDNRGNACLARLCCWQLEQGWHRLQKLESSRGHRFTAVTNQRRWRAAQAVWFDAAQTCSGAGENGRAGASRYGVVLGRHEAGTSAAHMGRRKKGQDGASWPHASVIWRQGPCLLPLPNPRPIRCGAWRQNHPG